MSTSLSIYLRNHEAAGQGGLDLFRRAARNQRRRPYAADLRRLAAEVADDLSALRKLMSEVGVSPDPVMGTVMRLGERVGRLKPNGHLVTRAPLSDLIEVEAMLDAAWAKANGWRSLQASGAVGTPEELAALHARAQEQISTLETIHAQVAAEVLSPPTP